MRRWLLASYLGVTLVALLLVVVPFGRAFASRERERLYSDIERDAVVVAGLVEDRLEAGEPPGIGTLLAQYARDPGGRILVVDRAGTAVADAGGTALGDDVTNRPEIATALSGRRTAGTRRSTTLAADLVYVAVPVTSSGVVHGAVRITYPTSAMDHRVRDNWIRLFALSALIQIAVAALALVVARAVAHPLVRLRDAVESVAGGTLTTRAAASGGPAEVRELAAAFNRMAERLQELVGAQQAFVADAAHQLRTPLASLRLQLENLEDEAPSGPLQARVAGLRSETARLGRLTEALLSLARAAGTGAAPTVVDLGRAIDDRIRTWRPIAATIDVELVAEAAGSDLHASALPGAIEQILDNLLANALDVAPAGTSVTVSAGVVAGSDGRENVAVHVIDHGPGMSESDRRRAFERFWRAAGAPPGGTGLGLAIVRELARGSGGDAELHEASGGGLDAVVTLPSASGQ